MSEQLSADLNIIQSAPIELELLDGDLNIIQKLDDEPNDVGGLTSAELKAKFDESGNIIKKYINETLIPAVLAEDATEESRKQAEAARVAAEQVRQSNEAARQNAEAQRVSAENARNVWEDYSSSKAYAVGNKVASAGSSYLCIKPCTGIAPPNAEYWRLIAAKGAKGDTGAQGAQGPQGPQGAIGPEGPVGGSSNFVRYDAAQSLTDDQKAQARGNIGAAPDGFGLGGSATLLTSADNLDALMKTGWYYYGTSNAPQGTLPTALTPYATLILVSATGNTCVQEAYDPTDSGFHNTVLRRTIYGVGTGAKIYPWEWVNPFMQLGVEYRTTERYLGKPVYKILSTINNVPPDTPNATAPNWSPSPLTTIIVGGTACLKYQTSGHSYPIPLAENKSNNPTVADKDNFVCIAARNDTNDYVFSVKLPASQRETGNVDVFVVIGYIKNTD